MATTETLDGTATPVDLGGGYVLRAQGLQGTATLYEQRAPGTRGPELATDAFDEALRNENVTELESIEIEARPVPAPATEAAIRGPRDEDAIELEVPDAGPNWGQVVLLVDEDGAVTWHFPLDEQNAIETSDVRGAEGKKRFRVRRHVPAPSDDPAAVQRNLLGSIGRKVLKHLVYPITDPIVGRISEHFARKWEEKKRPYRARLFQPGRHREAIADPIRNPEWTHIAGGRALLFIHGTFSTSHGGFGSLPDTLMGDLHAVYENRVFAFDHFTLSHDPVENVRRFMRMVPEELNLNVDIVCHSRGGLVARTLGERPDFAGVDTSRVDVRRIVFVGVPNNGTALADPKHMVHMLDRISTAVNLFPVRGVAEVLEAILTVVKVLGHGFLKSLDGLAAQRPGGAFLTPLNAVRDPVRSPEYYAITAEFEPGPGALRDLILDGAADWVFRGAPNDLVVPSNGVSEELECPGFPVGTERYHRAPTGPGILHINYFENADVHGKLRDWLL